MLILQKSQGPTTSLKLLAPRSKVRINFDIKKEENRINKIIFSFVYESIPDEANEETYFRS